MANAMRGLDHQGRPLSQSAVPRLESARVYAYVHKSRGGRFDPHNLMPTMKPVIDGFVDAGLLADDSAEYLDGPFMRAGEVYRDAPGLTVLIKAGSGA